MSWKSKKKYKRFSVLMRKEVDNKGNENIMINSYKKIHGKLIIKFC